MKINPDIIRNSIRFINEEVKKTENGNLTIKEAFAIAIKIESSMLEKGLFSLFTSKDKKMSELFGKLKNDTTLHFELLKKNSSSIR
jgi:uncharacterized protein YjgD (DUF1641 family)